MTLRVLLALGLWGLLVLVDGCGSGPSDPNPDAGALCAVAADCNDGLFCNGDETCAPSASGADARGCLAGSSPCPGALQTRIESSRTCMSMCDAAMEDSDSDGYMDVDCGGDDCDDEDPNRFPGNVERCDLAGHDEDCDESTIGDTDNDRDGFVDARCCNDLAVGGTSCGEDCDDTKRSVNPIASEVCDGFDNNCADGIDEGVSVPGYDDLDFDLRGSLSAPRMGCAERRGFAFYAGDCDDSDPAVSDLQAEVCDGVDNDCDGATDENTRPVPWYPDTDSDRFGLIEIFPEVSCAPPSAMHSLYTLDCDDTSSSVGPLAVEQCNARDDDCNGLADRFIGPGDFEDDDGDGYADTGCGGDDCDDRDFTTFPGAGDAEDGRDNDCDGEIDEGVDVTFYRDADRDGHGDPGMSMVATSAPTGYVSTAQDCDDDDDDRYPNAAEQCDGVDEDCDGGVDEGLMVVFCPDSDGDGFGGQGTGCSLACPDAPPAGSGVGALDCADGDAAVYPNAVEVCDAVDNDCDGAADCPFCGDDTCNLALGEDPIACNADCPSVCPDTYCSSGETTALCASDCLCGANEHVVNHRCVACTGGTTRPAGDDAAGADTACSDACQVALGISCAPFAEAYVKSQRTAIDNQFGASVAFDGDTLVVGEPWEDRQVGGAQGNVNSFNSGAVYVFVRTGSAWAQQAYLKAAVPTSVGSFGSAVALSGDTLAVTRVDAVDIFVRNGSSWTKQTQVIGQFSEAFDDFGTSLALAGDTLVVGASGEDSSATGIDGDQQNNDAGGSGAVYVFQRSGMTWTQQAFIKAENAGAGDLFGGAVALSGETLVVGAIGEDSASVGVGGTQANEGATSSGAAYVFTRSGAVWTQQAYLKASNTGMDDRFGASVAISGDTLVVGARTESSAASGVDGNQSDDTLSQSGAAYVFLRTGVVWAQQAYLKASTPGAMDNFGRSVAVSGDLLVVSANAEDSSALNVNGVEANEGASNSGAVYLFRRTGIVWAPVAYIKASNTGASDFFGSALTLSGNTLVVGVSLEDSSATGINGNQSNNSAGGAGAVYVRRVAP